MSQPVDYRQKKMQEWLELERQYSEIGAAIQPHLRKMDDDSVSDTDWDRAARAIDRLYAAAKHVSERKTEVANTIASFTAPRPGR
ncbi:hypothetical protein ACFPAF_17155 [Hymenobacter endophyticus]|uniref:General stress protein CsbD n=1 Tax=Hymenobacter endophyticus TaxID=3076335 RepID=A0ABU3TL74_9BACT|nr:hypothetical protein [Hymenobacter endophyticus]MDU0372134.1 hypothetical protein [Hymenobacter endophyticus]